MSKRAVLFVNLQKKNTEEVAAQIKAELEKRDYEAVVFTFEKKPEIPPGGKWDIAFSLGGDGTVLYAARSLAPFGVPILPVNFGTLGFIAEVGRDDWLDVFQKWEKGELSVSRRCMLEISVERCSEIITKKICLNDAVVSTSGIAKLVKLDVHIDTGIPLGSYRCDGLIISTPTGSTAYSMAAGGPIMDPEMEAVILNPICPFTLSNRPFVLPSGKTLSISVAQVKRSNVLLTVDGQESFDLESGDKVIIQQAPCQTLLIFAGKDSYYSALRKKLFWLPSAAAGDNNA